MKRHLISFINHLNLGYTKKQDYIIHNVNYKLTKDLIKLLSKQHFIKDCERLPHENSLKINLLYVDDVAVIQSLKTISKPSLSISYKYKELFNKDTDKLPMYQNLIIREKRILIRKLYKKLLNLRLHKNEIKKFLQKLTIKKKKKKKLKTFFNMWFKKLKISKSKLFLKDFKNLNLNILHYLNYLHDILRYDKIKNKENMIYNHYEIFSKSQKLIYSKGLKKRLYVLNYRKRLDDHNSDEIFVPLNEKYRPIISERINKVRYFKKTSSYQNTLNNFNYLENSNGLMILSTDKGLMSHHEIHKSKLGGKVICEIF